MKDPKDWPKELVIRLTRKEILRYGENPHQDAALYTVSDDTERVGITHARQVQGKELSFNNINDADAALECVSEFSEPAVVIVKHTNPCGVGLGENLYDAYRNALACDPVSAFGGVVAVNSTLNAKVAVELVKIFLEVIIAPDADEEALAILAVKPNLRVLLLGSMPDVKTDRNIFRSISDGVLVSTRDNTVFGEVSVGDGPAFDGRSSRLF